MCHRTSKLCENVGGCQVCDKRRFVLRPYILANQWILECVRRPNGEPLITAKFSNKKEKLDATCQKCKHDFSQSGEGISKGSWCPYCSNNFLCGKEDCQFCFVRSVASTDKAIFWSSNNEKKSYEVRIHSNVKYLWFCCGKDFLMQPNQAFRKGRDNFCPCCAGKTICGRPRDECEACFAKSFANCPGAENWSEELNESQPKDHNKSAHIHAWFDCAENQHPPYTARLDAVSLKGTGCPLCYHKSEGILYAFLETLGEHKPQYKIQGCKGKQDYRFDSCVLDYIITEIDGPQHYVESTFFGGLSLEEIQARDRYKENCALLSGHCVVRVYQPEVFRNHGNWRELLALT